MHCAKCGFEVNPNDNFCVHCGEKIPKTDQPAKPRLHHEYKLLLLQVFVCIVIAAVLSLFIFFGHAVIVQTVDDSPLLIGDFSLLHVIGSLVFGTERFPPSVLSIVMGVTTVLFAFAAPVFWLLSAAAALLHRGEKGIRRMSVVFTFLSVGSVCVLPHLAYMLISQLERIYANAAGVLLEDMKGITSTLSYIWAGIVILLMVSVWVLLFKRRKGAQRVKKNEK